MSDSQTNLWIKRKELGRSKYLLYYGVLPWGLGLTFIIEIIELLYTHEIIWNWIPVRLIVFALAGFFVASTRWQSMERKYEPAPEERP